MRACHDASFGGMVRLERNRWVVITRCVFFLVFVVKDDFVVIDNCWGIAIAFLFFVKFVQHFILYGLAQLGPSYLIFTTEHLPLGSRNHFTLFRRHSWFLTEPIVTLISISITGLSIPVRLVHFQSTSRILFIFRAITTFALWLPQPRPCPKDTSCGLTAWISLSMCSSKVMF